MKKIFYSTGVLLLLLACTKDKNVTEATNNEVITASSKTAAGPEWSGNTVHILHSAFSPSYLEVNINSTVTWINDDSVTHTVTSDKFDSGDIPAGGTFKFMFDNTGSYSYHCRYHGETATVIAEGIR